MNKRDILKKLFSGKPAETEKAKQQIKDAKQILILFEGKDRDGRTVTDEEKSEYEHVINITPDDLISDEIG